MKDLLIKLIKLYQQLLQLKMEELTPSQQISLIAQDGFHKGKDFTDDRKVDDEVSCAFAVSTILHEQDESVPIVTGTSTLSDFLEKSPLFKKVLEPEEGVVVISPTGEGHNPDMPHGHTGIYIDGDKIMSNSSATGLWIQNYTRSSWRTRYYWEGRYPVRLYKKVI